MPKTNKKSLPKVSLNTIKIFLDSLPTESKDKFDDRMIEIWKELGYEDPNLARLIKIKIKHIAGSEAMTEGFFWGLAMMWKILSNQVEANYWEEIYKKSPSSVRPGEKGWDAVIQNLGV